MIQQITSSLLMIRPVSFRYNEETAVNNYYQKAIDGLTRQEVQDRALEEFDRFAEKLKVNGINVIVISDTGKSDTPDSIFPNNWVSFHHDGKIGLYPMYAANRRQERRTDIFDILKKDHTFKVLEVVDFTDYENEDKFLEGTGSMILDRQNKIAYAAISLRTDPDVLDEFCKRFGYKPVKFTANQTVNNDRLPIYHTNVMMCIADRFAIICADSIDDRLERQQVLASLEESGKEIITISEVQKEHFAGNMLQVCNKDGDIFLVMSTAAYNSLNEEQITAIKKYCPIIHSSLDTIEALGGGSARCMLAEVFLPTGEA